jgi:predicted O-methyltransferase YrrM
MTPENTTNAKVDQQIETWKKQYNVSGFPYSTEVISFGCNEREYNILYNLAAAESVVKVLEIGPDQGASTEIIRLALSKKSTYELVTVDFRPEPKVLQLLTERTNHKHIVMFSAEFWKSCKEKYDFIFVDGDHTFLGSLSDISEACKHLTQNGVVAVHDVYHPGSHYIGDNCNTAANASFRQCRLINTGGHGMGVIW